MPVDLPDLQARSSARVTEPAAVIAALLAGEVTADALPDDQLADALRVLHRGRGLPGQIVAALHDVHGWTWQRIADLLAADGNTVAR